MIDPKKDIFKWGPIDGKPVYMDGFNEAFITFPNLYGISWPECMGYFSEGKGTYMLEDKALRDKGEELFLSVVMDKKKREEAYASWERAVKKLLAFEEIVNSGLHRHDDARLAKLYSEWHNVHNEFWNYGFVPEVSNWGAERLLKEAIGEHHPANFIEIFEALSAPDELSFFQTEELELMNIRLAEKRTMQIMLNAHQKKYYWLRNSYGHTQVLDAKFFQDEMATVSEDDARRKISEIRDYALRIKARKENIIRKYSVNDEIKAIAEMLSYCVWWQDYRKRFIFIANHINSVFLKEIDGRKGIDFEDLEFYTEPEIIKLLFSDEAVDVADRKDNFILYYEEKAEKLEILEGDEALSFVEPFLKHDVGDSQKVVGLVVSKGPLVKGRARIVFSPKEAGHFEHGDILIAPMTSPDFVVLMRKASAIITDVGGMTSHAAIVSRELGKPCIVGTKAATKIFKDGEMIEVNTEKGVVRKLR